MAPVTIENVSNLGVVSERLIARSPEFAWLYFHSNPNFCKKVWKVRYGNPLFKKLGLKLGQLPPSVDCFMRFTIHYQISAYLSKLSPVFAGHPVLWSALWAYPVQSCQILIQLPEIASTFMSEHRKRICA